MYFMLLGFFSLIFLSQDEKQNNVEHERNDKLTCLIHKFTLNGLRQTLVPDERNTLARRFDGLLMI